jgi:hypothetical protein
MRQKFVMAVSAVALRTLVIFPMVAVAAQNPAPVSLEEQLRAQYQLARLDASQKQVLERGSVLVMQKEGVFAVAPNLAACPSKYENGNLHPPSGLCVDNAKSGSRNFLVGEKVYPTGMTIDLKQGSIALAVSSTSTFDRALVVFQFPQGYLEKANVPEVEDKIGEVLAIYTPLPEATATAPTEQPAAVGATPGQALMNDDIIRLVQLKFGDSLVITKIKSSACAFDTSTDALVKLKAAGVSDAVLQSMLEAGSQPMAAPPAQPNPPPVGPPPAPACADYASCLATGSTALGAGQWDQSLSNFQKASTWDPTEPEAWEGMGDVYLALGQYSQAATMWDKALRLGGTLTFLVWQYAGSGYEKGTFRLSAKEVSFFKRGQLRAFSASPEEVSSVRSHRGSQRATADAWAFGMKVGGRNYWFSSAPLGVDCETPIQCGDPAGYGQEGVVANYVTQAIGKLAPGSLAK